MKKNKKPEPKLRQYEIENSSNIKLLEHDRENNILYTTYNHGGRWKYEGITRDMVNEIRKSESVGATHHKLVVSNNKGERTN